MFRLKLFAKWTLFVLIALVLIYAAVFSITAAMAASARSKLRSVADIDIEKYRPFVVEGKSADELFQQAGQPLAPWKCKSYFRISRDRGNVGAMKEADLDELLAFVTGNRDALDRMDGIFDLEALSNKQNGSPYLSHSYRWPFPSMVAWGDVSRLITLAAPALALRGDREGAFRLLALQRKLLEHIRRFKPFDQVSGLLFSEFLTMYARALVDITHFFPTDPRCAEALAFMQTLDLRSIFKESLLCEAAKDNADFWGTFLSSESSEWIPRWYQYTPVFNIDRRYVMREWARLFANWDLPIPELLAIYSPGKPDAPSFYRVNNLTGVRGGQMVEFLAKKITLLRLAACAMVLEQYRVSNGRLPTSLGDAFPGGAASATTDPCVGRPFIYRADGAGYLLYGLNVDQYDNGGDRDSDIVIIYTPLQVK